MSQRHEKVLTLHLRPGTQEWGSAENDKWKSDLAELDYLLRRALPEESGRATTEPASGRKGTAEFNDVILALGSAGVISGALEVIKAWIAARPRWRTVEVEYDGPTGKGVVRVEADGLGAQELKDLAERALPGA